MKQILLILTLTLFSFSSFSQDEPSRATSTKLSLSEKSEDTGEFIFPPYKTIEEVNILIGVDKIVIESEIPQVYYGTSETKRLEDFEGSYWYASDFEGNSCRVYLYLDKNNEICLAIEYHDYSWIYVLNPKEDFNLNL